MAFAARAAELRAQGHRVVALSLGEPDEGAPPAVLEALHAVTDGRPLPYTPALGLPELRGAIAQRYRERHGVDLDPRRVVVTSGASAALVLVTALVVDPGDDVLMADPSYPCNRQIVRALGGRAVEVATTPATRYQLSAAAVEAAWTPATRAVLVATPSNPTGTTVPQAELEAVCRLARERGAWRVVDEIYLDLADPVDGAPPRSALALDDDAVVIGSFSKHTGMTGWRLGWCVVPERAVEAVERMASNFFICASAPAQHAALAAFTPASLELVERRRLDLLQRRALVLEGLAAAGLEVPVPPDGAFYAYVDVSGTGLGAWELCERLLAEEHVALTPGRDFGATTADTHVRLSYAASREELAEGLARLQRFTARLRSSSSS
ncbi:aminotransferase class I/II-fold pyridoxal phosphate-dependent enzyme [Quadrisphaera oryzae]|uniref:aminotransferase class I/II-fold pyridoxal phosphate-dependent enzyme n=1 Tax=Quadrisphaera TaxID=317661 RepID=UPI0016441B23|nr:aminotransferase class I/II-fold pyridoxal phosphate-dependent enzyme [Quadrisphaera sp. RL12-1S]MBC3760660.1 aminotransferase class I/II-fold pyridoxal phosphate-dependent enzyme [Quadrisphaera sp. RL12-1S]